MTKFKLLTMSAIVAGMFAVSAPAEARFVKDHPETSMQKEYGFEKDHHKMMKKKHHHKKAAAAAPAKEEPKKDAPKKHHHKKKKMMMSHHNHGTTPNECIKPPCGMNYDH